MMIYVGLALCAVILAAGRDIREKPKKRN